MMMTKSGLTKKSISSKIKNGPVGPRIISGWPLNKPNTMPLNDVANNISSTQNQLFVFSAT